MRFHSETMALATAVWVCSLPLVAIVLIPIVGLKMTGAVALALLFLALAVCWGFCGWKVWRGPLADRGGRLRRDQDAKDHLSHSTEG